MLSEEQETVLIEETPIVSVEDALDRMSLMIAAYQYVFNELKVAKSKNRKLEAANISLQMQADFHRNQADQLRVAYDNLRKNPLKVFFSQFRLFGGK